jgi:hypothetical protein
MRAPWAILLVVVAQMPPKLWLSTPYLGSLPLEERIPEVLFVLLPVPFSAVGALIGARRPRPPDRLAAADRRPGHLHRPADLELRGLRIGR